MFRTKYDHVRVFTPPGDPEVTEYVGRYDKDGILQLEESGKRNLYDEIQSHAESVDINNIIRRYENGEVDVLSRIQGAYEDIFDAPRSFAEMLNLVNAAEQLFEQLPVDIKNEYNNSFVEFFQQDGMNRIRPEADRVEMKEEVVENES